MTTDVAIAPLVVDPDREHQLTQEGYTCFPLLSEGEVAALRDLYAALRPRPGVGFDTDFTHPSPALKAAIDVGIREIVAPALDALLVDSQLFNVTFVVKWPGGGSEVPLHQDWTYVDERVARGVTIWIPLRDTSPEIGNGPLGIVPRSHLLPAVPRGANTVPWYQAHRDQLDEHRHFEPLTAGSALIFDNRVLHGSPANETAEPRIAVALMAARAEVPLRYLHQSGSTVRAYAIEPSFFVDHSPCDLRSHVFADPSGVILPLLETFAAEPPRAPRAALVEHLGVSLRAEGPEPSEHRHVLRGTPLGESRPAASAGWLRRQLHAEVGRVAPGPALPRSEAIDRSLLTVAAGAAKATVQLADLDGTEGSFPVSVRFGRAAAMALDAPGVGPLVTCTSADLGRTVRGAWLLWLAAEGELEPRRLADRGGEALVTTLGPGGYPGRLVLQAGHSLLPLEPGEVVHADLTWEHTIWNAAPVGAWVLVVVVDRDLPRRLRWALSLRGGAVAPTELATGRP
jgi:hypothetical protein